MRYKLILGTFAALIVISTVPKSAMSDNLESQRAALLLIRDFADRFCPIPKEGSTTNLELSGTAKAELPTLLKHVAALGIQGAAKYQQSQYEGLLQKDVLPAFRDSMKCRSEVLSVLVAKLFAPSSTKAAALMIPVREQLATFISEGNALMAEWSKRLGGPEEVQSKSANAVIEWHGRVAAYLRKPPLGPLYVARFENRTGDNTGLPMGINLRLAGFWKSLERDLAKLEEFIKDPNLGLY